MGVDLYWLPEALDWRLKLKTLQAKTDGAWEAAMLLASLRLDFVRINALDGVLRGLLRNAPPSGLETRPVRLALLGSCTLTHLHAAIRVAGLRRGIWISIYENDYGQYLQELSDPESALYRFKPNVLLIALDAHHLVAGFSATMEPADAKTALEEVKSRIRQCWLLAREAFSCPVIQQTALPVHPQLLGNNEHRLPSTHNAVIASLNAALRQMVDAHDVDLLAVDSRSANDGLAAWHDKGLWHRAKQEISPVAAPLYGELVGRLLAAQQGRSFKCLVLDLDNTIWGGVVGDDGLAGLVLGQGSALGEAYVAFQEYVRELSRRGVILAVCSKNDEANALEPFERHPEMVLKRSDIASFVANWSDKAANIRSIAEELNIGLDSLVFVDDNPVERDLVRRELPMVAVPELPDDPADYAQTLADAGYFESLAITGEDRARSTQYQGNRARDQLKVSSTDLPSYLRSLEMQLNWHRFDKIGLQRTVQLINKTNQFNLTTRRYTEEDVLALMQDERSFGLQLRLIDRFGDNGIIGIVIGRMNGGEDLLIDTWLMSCRVLGRQVEPVTLNLIAAEAQKFGALRLVGEYIPSKKNGIVKGHYQRLGFHLIEARPDGGSMTALELASFTPAETFIQVKEG